MTAQQTNVPTPEANDPNTSPEEQQIMQLYATLDVAAQAINRLESFCFSMTKMLIDAKLFTTGDLDLVMQILHKHNNLETFWSADINDEIQALIAERQQAQEEAEAQAAASEEESPEESSEESFEESEEGEETAEEVEESDE